jgi:cell division transport system permease protein
MSMSTSMDRRAKLSDAAVLREGRGLGPMPWVLAILMFITVLAAAAGLAMGTAAHRLSNDLSHRLTIQIVEANPDIRHAQTDAVRHLLAGMPAIRSVDVVDEATLDRLVAPWLGKDAAEAGLPYPALIDITTREGTDLDVAALTSDLVAVAPSVHVEPDMNWLAPFARLLTLMTALAAAIVVLMMVAVAAAVVLSARAALNTHRSTIDILHLMGASDSQISQVFQRRIASEALISGTIGLVGAVVVLVGVGAVIASTSSEFLGGIILEWWAWIGLALLPLFAAGLANLSARATVMRALRKML